MKKMMLLGALVFCAAAVGHAQESRQDVSASFIGVYAPDTHGLGATSHTSNTGGFLGSYRFMLTPRSALELNYSWAQHSMKFYNGALNNEPGTGNNSPGPGEVHFRQQEITGAYIYSRTYKRYNPFLEAGGGGYIFTPILDNGTHIEGTKQNTNIGFLFGGGMAYELSPSFDIRAEYRGFLLKSPDFGDSYFKTNRYYVLMTPSIGVAYHF
jgi:opacity protein-like surface antigen